MKKINSLMIVLMVVCFTLISCSLDVEMSYTYTSNNEVLMNVSTSNTKMTLTVKKISSSEIAAAVIIDGDTIQKSVSYPFSCKKKLMKGSYEIKLVYSESYHTAADGKVYLLEPIKEAHKTTIKVK